MKNMHVQGPQINQFNNIAPQPIPRSVFMRDYPRRMTFDVDKLYPLMVDEILPGDDINVRLNALVRLATPLKPFMDNLYFETFWFFVPNRLVWDNWEKFQGQQTDPGDSVAYTIPVLDVTKAPMSTTGFATGSVYDYINLPTLVTGLDGVSCLFNRAMDLIWNEWFRDENFMDSLPIAKGDGPDDPAIYDLRKRRKRKDYITSCLPWPQKGDPVSISLSGTAPVVISDAAPIGQSYSNIIPDPAPYSITMMTANDAGPRPMFANGTTDDHLYLAGLVGAAANTQWVNSGLVGDITDIASKLEGEADLTGASAITINALRQAALYQQILELDARGGTRYVESIYSRFGVISPDFRLQRPELIGLGSSKIHVYAVPQTSASGDDTTPQGNLAAFGTLGINREHGCRYSATEHGMLIAFCNVRADLTYQQGLPKMFTRSTRLDFYEPLLNGLGEQAVLKKELMAQGTTVDEEVLGYQERFAEYRFRNAEIIGQFRSNATGGSLDNWHLSQEVVVPLLNQDFLESNTPIDRVVAVTNEPDFLMDAYFNYRHVRPMPIRSNPGITRL